MDNVRLTVVRRPADGKDIKARRTAEQALRLQEVQREVGQAALLGGVYRFGGASGVGRFGGAHFHEHDTIAIERDQIEFAVWTGVVARKDATTATAEKSFRRAFASRAEPTPPPGAARLRCVG